MAIDADYEERKLEELTRQVSDLKTDYAFRQSEIKNRWDDCVAKVQNLPVSDAYNHYANGTRP